MGGRGTYGGGITAYDNIKMNYPVMDGSDKQIQYAKDLIDKQLNESIEKTKYEYAVIKRLEERVHKRIEKGIDVEKSEEILKECILRRKILDSYSRELKSAIKGNVQNYLGDHAKWYKSKESNNIYAGYVINRPKDFVHHISDVAINKVLKKHNLSYRNYTDNYISSEFLGSLV